MSDPDDSDRSAIIVFVVIGVGFVLGIGALFTAVILS